MDDNTVERLAEIYAEARLKEHLRHHYEGTSVILLEVNESDLKGFAETYNHAKNNIRKYLS